MSELPDHSIILQRRRNYGHGYILFSVFPLVWDDTEPAKVRTDAAVYHGTREECERYAGKNSLGVYYEPLDYLDMKLLLARVVRKAESLPRPNPKDLK